MLLVRRRMSFVRGRALTLSAPARCVAPFPQHVVAQHPESDQAARGLFRCRTVVGTAGHRLLILELPCVRGMILQVQQRWVGALLCKHPLPSSAFPSSSTSSPARRARSCFLPRKAHRCVLSVTGAIHRNVRLCEGLVYGPRRRAWGREQGRQVSPLPRPTPPHAPPSTSFHDLPLALVRFIVVLRGVPVRVPCSVTVQ